MNIFKKIFGYKKREEYIEELEEYVADLISRALSAEGEKQYYKDLVDKHLKIIKAHYHDSEKFHFSIEITKKLIDQCNGNFAALSIALLEEINNFD